MPSLQIAPFLALPCRVSFTTGSRKIVIPRAFFQLISLAFVLAGVSAAQDNQLRYSLPDRKGALSVQLGTLRIEDMNFKPDGTGVRILARSPEGLIMTLFIQPAEKPGDSTVCRSEWWSKTRKGVESKVKIKDVKTYELGSIAVAEYRVPEFKRAPVDQKSVHAYFAGGDLWGEIHLSKVQSRPQDDKLFSTVLEKATMDAAYVPTPLDYLQYGSATYLLKDYKN